MTKAKTVQTAHVAACVYWASGGSGYKAMATRSAKCARAVGLDTKLSDLGAEHGTKLLAALRADRGLGPTSVVSYYSAFLRGLNLSGVSTTLWPKPPPAPRVKKRDPFPDDLFHMTLAKLIVLGYRDTADLAGLIRHSGMRPGVEALKPKSWSRFVTEVDYDSFTVVGKGGHEREVLITDPDARALLRDKDRLGKMLAVTYRTHARHWRIAAHGVDTRLPTLHSLRHAYGSEILDKTNNLELARQLLGHANLKTTSNYMREYGAKGAFEVLAKSASREDLPQE